MWIYLANKFIMLTIEACFGKRCTTLLLPARSLLLKPAVFGKARKLRAFNRFTPLVDYRAAKIVRMTNGVGWQMRLDEQLNGARAMSQVTLIRWSTVRIGLLISDEEILQSVDILIYLPCLEENQYSWVICTTNDELPTFGDFDLPCDRTVKQLLTLVGTHWMQ